MWRAALHIWELSLSVNPHIQRFMERDASFLYQTKNWRKNRGMFVGGVPPLTYYVVAYHSPFGAVQFATPFFRADPTPDETELRDETTEEGGHFSCVASTYSASSAYSV